MARTTQEQPLDLPIGFNAWLLECTPVRGCGACSASLKQVFSAKEAGNITLAAKHAAEIRSHAGGHC